MTFGFIYCRNYVLVCVSRPTFFFQDVVFIFPNDNISNDCSFTKCLVASRRLFVFHIRVERLTTHRAYALILIMPTAVNAVVESDSQQVGC